MISQIAYTIILGRPIIFYMGILTISSLITTASIGYLNRKGIHLLPFRWHFRMAASTVTIAVVHALMGLSGYYGL